MCRSLPLFYNDSRKNDWLYIVTEDDLKAGQLNISAIPAGFVMQNCPAPFLKDPLAETGSTATVDEKHCRYGCCIPCPAQNLVRYFF